MTSAEAATVRGAVIATHGEEFLKRCRALVRLLAVTAKRLRPRNP